MEIAKFVIQCVLAALAVGGTLAGVLSHYKKKFDEQIKDVSGKTDTAKAGIDQSIKEVKTDVKKSIEDSQIQNEKKIDEIRNDVRDMQRTINENFQQRLGNIEGEMKANTNILRSIQEWFIHNTPAK